MTTLSPKQLIVSIHPLLWSETLSIQEQYVMAAVAIVNVRDGRPATDEDIRGLLNMGNMEFYAEYMRTIGNMPIDEFEAAITRLGVTLERPGLDG